MKKFVALSVALFTLTACEPSGPLYTIDRKVYAERFDACMKIVPAGPTHITAAGNDWDEIVGACGIEARSQARVCIKNCANGEWY